MDPVIAQEMMTLRDDTVFPFAKRVQARSGEGIGERATIRRPKVIIGQRDQDVNLWKSGARFSLKAATPSFDSGVS
jgi:hypothetical protein